jgi:two-component system cell cycle response regulator
MTAQKPQVLIVEDTFSNVVLLQAKLLDRQFESTVAYNGLEALDLIDAQTFDLVLLDIMLPGMDGFEVCRRIRLHPRCAGVPVIMLTALDTERDRSEGFAAGADDYFLKPVEDDVLFGRIQTLIADRTTTAESGPQAGLKTRAG